MDRRASACVIQGMAQRLKNIDRNTAMLLPPDLRDWVAEDDLVHFVIAAVERLPLSHFALNLAFERGLLGSRLQKNLTFHDPDRVPLGMFPVAPEVAKAAMFVARDLASRPGRSLVVAGESQPVLAQRQPGRSQGRSEDGGHRRSR